MLWQIIYGNKRRFDMNYYFIQDIKTKQVTKKHETFKGAIALVKTLRKMDAFEIIATEIDDGYSGQIRLYNGEELYKAVDKTNNYIELDSGRWIKVICDGKYHLNGNDNVRFAKVCINRYDYNGKYLSGEVIGYVQI